MENAGSHQQLLAIGKYQDGSTRDLTGEAQWTVSNPALASVDREGMLKAISDGKVTATAAIEGQRAQAQFEIHGTGAARTFEFAREIGGIFTRKGCNNSTCHGGVKGRGGLKLSSGALYPKDDYEWIVKGGAYQVLTAQVTGPRVPRIDLQHPEKSLLLLKPTGAVPHGGGRRFPVDSPEYKAILQWIKDGAPYGPESAVDNKVVSLEIFPKIRYARTRRRTSPAGDRPLCRWPRRGLHRSGCL
jgi:hypothetical protein